LGIPGSKGDSGRMIGWKTYEKHYSLSQTLPATDYLTARVYSTTEMDQALNEKFDILLL
jgi:hypothetical protein